MLHPIRNLVTDWRKGDGERLVRLELDADVNWPGGGGGWQTTAEEQERDIRESDLLGAFVTEDADRLVAICTLNAKPGQKEHAFVPHLNCHPDYQGKKHGKSVLRAAVAHAYEAGYRKVNLYTWPGNMRAVPLYKKTGFMWEPDTSVHMENFTPAARRHPLGQAYFSDHDWYETLVRELTLAEDLVERGRVKVYEYLWQEGDSFLRMVFDRQSWGLLEVETETLMASCSLPDEKLVAGIPHTVRWRVVNKRPDPVQVFLVASGDPGVQIDKHEILEVRNTAEMDACFTLDPDIPEKTQDPKSAILRTSLVVGGQDVELAAGITVQQAVRAGIRSRRTVIAPGSPQTVALSLQSNLRQACTARVAVAPAGAINVTKREHRVDLAARSGAELPVEVSMAEEGAAGLDVVVETQTGELKVSTKRQRLDLLSASPMGVAGGVGEKHAHLSAGSLAIHARLRDGTATVYHTIRGRQAQRMEIGRPQLGPPFSWQDLFDEKADAWIERTDGAVTLCLRTKSILRPGLILERRITLDRGPVVQVGDTVINGSGRSYDLSVRQAYSMRSTRGCRWVVPKVDGVYRDVEGGADRGLMGLKQPKEGDRWPEGWICLERPGGCAVGVIWEAADRVSAGRHGDIQRTIGRIRPGASATLPPLRAFVGDGNWQTVKGWWQLLAGDCVPDTEDTEAATHTPIEMGVSPAPVIVGEGQGKARLSIRSVGDYRLDGTLHLDTPPGLRADVSRVPVKGLREGRPVSRGVNLTSTRRAAAGPLTLGLRFENEEARYRAACRAIVLDRRSTQVGIDRVDNGKALVLDNGILRVKVVPEFLGSVVSLERDGAEFVYSAYPEARIRGWENPWHGGIRPHYDRLWGQLHKERFRGRVVQRKGKQGLVWRGVRVTCRVKLERARGHVVSLDYLLAPGVDVLAVVPTCRDVLGIASTGQMGFWIYPALAETSGNAAFYSPQDRSFTALAAPHWFDAGEWKWGGLVSDRGEALFLSASGEGAWVSGESMGRDGCLLFGSVERHMPARGRVEGLCFVGPTQGEEGIEAHAAWSEFGELP